MTQTYPVLDVARFFIDYYGRSADPVNLARVQMFVYYAQAESLCRNGRPLFEDDFRAYPSGPAITRLNVHFEDYGNQPITLVVPFDDSVFEDDDLKLLMDVAVFYNDFSTSRMEIMAFAHGGPWEQVYSQGEDLAVIEKDVITEYHSKFDRVPDYKAYMFSMLQRSCGMIRSTEDAVRHDESTAIYSQNGSSKA